MANPEHVAKLKEGLDAWYKWRQANPEVRPDLEGLDFTTDEFRGTVLRERDEEGSEFISLRYMNFKNARLQSSNLEGVCLRHAQLQEAILCYATLQGADLSHAKLNGVDLSSAKLQHTKLKETVVEDGDLSEADLQNADLQNANFGRAILRSTKFHNADLSKTNFQEAELVWADFQNADLWKTDLRRADLRGANLEGANVTGVQFSSDSRQRNFQGIRVSTCYGSQAFKSFAQDQDFIEELRDSGWWGWFKFVVWLVSSNCGRSFILWGFWSILMAISFGFLYHWMGKECIDPGVLPFSLKTMMYYSVVTFTTLGFGDIKPLTENAAMWVMVEVILGYIMLGGLISIFANKVARRS